MDNKTLELVVSRGVASSSREEEWYREAQRAPRAQGKGALKVLMFKIFIFSLTVEFYKI